MKIIFDETIEHHIVHPVTKTPLYLQKKDKQRGVMVDDKTKPMIAVVYGKQTSKFKSSNTQAVRETFSIPKELEKGTEEYERKVDEIEANAIFKLIKELKNVYIETEHGVVSDDNPEVAVKVYWLREQLNQAIGKTEDFLQKPSKA